MLILNLCLYFNLKDSEFAKECRSLKAPENVNLEFFDVEGVSDFKMPDKKDAAVITDDPFFAEALISKKNGHLDIIYRGNMIDVSRFADELSDIWNPNEGLSGALWRVNHVVRGIKAKYDAWGNAMFLEEAISITPDMMWFKREDGIHTMVNPAFCDTVDKTREDVTGKDHFYIWDVTRDETQGDNDCSESERQVIAAGKMLTFEEQVLSKGNMKQLTVYKGPIYDWFGNVWGTVGLGHDVTNFSNMGIELDILVDSLPFPVAIFDADYKVIKLNDMAHNLIKMTETNEDDFYYPRWKHEKFEPVGKPQEDLQKNSVSQEVVIDVIGEPLTYIVSEAKILDYFENISGYFVIMRDITFQKTYEQTILNAANTDVLTGLFNRRYFYEYLGSHKSDQMTLLYLDLDHFKEINDTYGHARGDEVLKKTAAFIRRYFNDCKAARLGGDEFAVVIRKRRLDEEKIKENCEKLEEAVRGLFKEDGPFVTVSIGRADSEGDSDMDVDAFIHKADGAMYDVKKEHHGLKEFNGE